jgi:hypothetical protein
MKSLARVDAVTYGINSLAPALLGYRPDLVVSGSNVGSEYFYRSEEPKLNKD